MKKLLLFLLVITGQFVFAQQYSIEGRVLEKQADVLPFASVMLLQPGDSSLLLHTTTNAEGKFILKEVKEGEYIFKVSFLGFAPYFQNLKVSTEADTLNLGNIELQPKTIELSEVTVTEAKAAVLVKEDTVEYNAASFTTLPNASVGQLLKKLPGLFVDKDGNINVLGESVTRIYVDGKEYFGSNLQMAIRNLPAGAIDKIQLIDEKSEEARFSGLSDGRRKKVINVTLKENWRNSGFGKAMAGVGTSDRYAAQANYNLLTEGNMLSVTGMSNNINNLDHSSGRSSAGRDGQDGLLNTHSGGVNFFNQLSGKTKINGSYLLDYTDANIKSNLIRQNFLPQGTAMYYENSRQQSTSNFHNANAGIEHTDSINTLKLNTSFSFMEAGMQSISSRQSFSVADTLVNEGERSAMAQNKSYGLNAELFYGHRFRKSGRLLTVKSYFSTNQDEAKGRSESFTRFRDGSEDVERQRKEQENDELNYRINFAFTEPIGKEQYLQANYNVANQSSNSNLEVFDIINETSLFNAEQSSRFSSAYQYQQLGLHYRLNRDQYNLALGAHVQQSALSRKVALSSDQVTQSFQNILPSLNFNIRLKNAGRLNFDYITSVREPSIEQLQPVISRFDPLNLYIGNPGLRPEYTHQGRLKLNTSAIPSGIFLSGSLNFNYTTNPITPAVSIDERQVRITQYVNVKESMNFAVFLNAGIPVKRYNSQFNLSPYLSQVQSANLLNGVEGRIKQQTMGGKFAYNYSFKEYIDFNLRSNIAVTRSDNELSENQQQFFMTSSYQADATLYFKKFSFTPEFDLGRFSNASTGFDQAIPFFNISLSRYLLNNNRGELKLSAFNVLNRNVGVRQVATLNYIEQSTQNTLGKFYMLSFTYNLQQSSE